MKPIIHTENFWRQILPIVHRILHVLCGGIYRVVWFVSGYTLTYMRKNVAVSKETIDLPPSSRNYTITGLTATTTYTIEIFAKTRIGPGPASATDIDSGIPPGRIMIRSTTTFSAKLDFKF